MSYFLLLVLFPVANVAGGILNRHEYNFTIAYANNSTSVLLVNNQFPGPMIRANVHDKIIVHIHNALHTMEEVTIHFHGILQQQTPQMDGVGFVTQMPIPSQRTFTYVFYAYPAGTHLYHSHAGLQSVTAFGALIIDDPLRPWEAAEAPSGPIALSDHWEGIDRLQQEEGLLASPFKWEGEPSTLLINGQRNYVLTLDPGNTYLLRLIGATSLSTVVFGINEHPMTVVEVDGKLVRPRYNMTSIEIASGQRYAVMIETKNQLYGVFAMQASIRWRMTTANSRLVDLGIKFIISFIILVASESYDMVYNHQFQLIYHLFHFHIFSMKLRSCCSPLLNVIKLYLIPKECHQVIRVVLISKSFYILLKNIPQMVKVFVG
jgi:hypothetical protein